MSYEENGYRRCKDRSMGLRTTRLWAIKLGGNYAEKIREDVIKDVIRCFPGSEEEVSEVISLAIETIKERL